MDERRSVIPSDTSDPVFSPPSTLIFDIEEEDEEEEDEENIEPLSAEDPIIPDDMRAREKAYRDLKEKMAVEAEEYRLHCRMVDMVDLIWKVKCIPCKQLDICEHSFSDHCPEVSVSSQERDRSLTEELK